MIQVVLSILCCYASTANIILYPWPTEKRAVLITSSASALKEQNSQNCEDCENT